MGQKVYPTGFRLGVTENWRSRWYADKDYAATLDSDIKIRRFIEAYDFSANGKKNANAEKNDRRGSSDPALAKIEIERAGDKVKVILTTAKPGIVIGRKGESVDNLRKELEAMTGAHVSVEVIEVKRPELDANLIAQSIASQLEGRVAFRRAMRKAVTAARKSGAKGIRIQCSGRLGGAEMSRREWYREGRVPLHTLRAMIDYGFATAHTTMGACGVKVWVYYGEVLPGQKASNPSLEGSSNQRRGRGRREGRNN